jgi:valyl-tRNA synthetase
MALLLLVTMAMALRSPALRLGPLAARPAGLGSALHVSSIRRANLHTGRSSFSSHRSFASSLAASRPDFFKEKDSKYFEYTRLENQIYQWWEQSKLFAPQKEEKKQEKFVITMPPPNVTGYLHMGHAIFLALQDIMIRYNRMVGKDTLWLPGT